MKLAVALLRYVTACCSLAAATVCLVVFFSVVSHRAQPNLDHIASKCVLDRLADSPYCKIENFAMQKEVVGDHNLYSMGLMLGDMAQLGSRLKKMPKGKIVISAPLAMKVGDVKEISVAVGADVSLDSLRAQVEDQGLLKTGILNISPEMSAGLFGPAFKINSLTKERQSIAKGYPTTWRWSIEATSEGDKLLTVTVYAILVFHGKEISQQIESYAQKISVEVKQKTFSEWLDAGTSNLANVNAIIAGLTGVGTVLFSWVGFLLGRKRHSALERSPRPQL